MNLVYSIGRETVLSKSSLSIVSAACHETHRIAQKQNDRFSFSSFLSNIYRWQQNCLRARLSLIQIVYRIQGRWGSATRGIVRIGWCGWSLTKKKIRIVGPHSLSWRTMSSCSFNNYLPVLPHHHPTLCNIYISSVRVIFWPIVGVRDWFLVEPSTRRFGRDSRVAPFRFCCKRLRRPDWIWAFFLICGRERNHPCWVCFFLSAPFACVCECALRSPILYRHTHTRIINIQKTKIYIQSIYIDPEVLYHRRMNFYYPTCMSSSSFFYTYTTMFHFIHMAFKTQKKHWWNNNSMDRRRSVCRRCVIVCVSIL